MREKATRRVAGLLAARLPELDLEGVPDPRAREGRWKLPQILRATLLGLMAGCRSLWEAEQLTERLAPAMRRWLGLPRRLADTTARDALCRVPLDGLRAVLHRAVRAAWRRKALAPVGVPVSVVALDAGATAPAALVSAPRPEVLAPLASAAWQLEPPMPHERSGILRNEAGSSSTACSSASPAAASRSTSPSARGSPRSPWAIA